MPQSAQKQDTNSNLFATLHDATRRYKLRDLTKDITNDQLAAHLQLEHHPGDYMGLPNCCLFLEGRLVAIRTKPDEVSIFHLWQRFQRRMEDIADRVE